MLIALGLGLAAWALQIKLKSPTLSLWFWRLLYSGVALFALGFILDALNPGVDLA